MDIWSTRLPVNALGLPHGKFHNYHGDWIDRVARIPYSSAYGIDRSPLYLWDPFVSSDGNRPRAAVRPECALGMAIKGC